MSQKDRYKPKPSDFMDYAEGRMKGRRRNEFERYLERNLFDAEAAEGFSMVSREEAEADLAALDRRIDRRIRRRRRIGWYSTAAAIVTILVVTTIFFNVDQNITEKREPLEELSPDMKKAKAVEEEKGGERDEATGRLGEEESERAGERESERMGEQENEAVETELAEPERGVTEITVPEPGKAEMAEPDLAAGEGDIAAKDLAPAAREEAITLETVEDDEVIMEEIGIDEEQEIEVMEFAMDADEEVGEDVLAAEAAQPAAVSTEKAAIREVSAVRRAVDKGKTSRVAGAPVSMEAKKAASATAAQPLASMTAYKEYIDSTLVFPAAELSRTNVYVDVKFYILPNGRPYNIQVDSSPAEAFSNEVHRVITNGPDWIPATRDGEYVEEALEMRIEFSEKHKR